MGTTSSKETWRKAVFKRGYVEDEWESTLELCENEEYHEFVNDAVTKKGETALHIACIGQAPLKVVAALLDAKAEVDSRTDMQLTPLHCVCIGGTGLDKLNLLHEKGADVNAQTEYGWTPLMFATLHDREEYAARLLELGADAKRTTTKEDSGIAASSNVAHIARQRSRTNVNLLKLLPEDIVQATAPPGGDHFEDEFEEDDDEDDGDDDGEEEEEEEEEEEQEEDKPAQAEDKEVDKPAMEDDKPAAEE